MRSKATANLSPRQAFIADFRAYYEGSPNSESHPFLVVKKLMTQKSNLVSTPNSSLKRMYSTPSKIFILMKNTTSDHHKEKLEKTKHSYFLINHSR